MSSRARPPKTTVAITGASGQLGTQIVRRLLDDRSVGKIVAIDRVAPSLVSSKLHHVAIDIRDPDIARSFEGAEVVIHLAFIVTSRLPRAEFDDINVNGSKNVFEAAERAKVRQILYASSIAAYGVAPGLADPLVEDSPRRLVDDFPYSAAKYRVEEYLDELERAHPELAIARIRPSILVGARFNNPLGELFARGLAARLLLGGGGAEMPVVWDEDVADLFVLAMKAKARGAFNATSDEPVNLETLARETGLRFVNVPEAGLRAVALFSRFSRSGAVDPSWQKHAGVRLRPVSDKAKRELGWSPKHPTALAVMKHYLETANGRTDRRIAMFMRLVAFGAKHAPPDPEAAGMDAVVHLAITGRGGADYTIRVRDRRISITPGVPRPPTSIATLDAGTFRDLLGGRISYATVNVTGRVRIEGDTSAGFVLPSIFARFRAECEQKNLRGRAMRGLARFLEGVRT